MVSIVVSSRSTPSRATPWTRIRGRESVGFVARRPTTRPRAMGETRATPTRETTTRETTTVTIQKPLGLTLEAGRGDVGAFVANVAAGSNAARTEGVARRDVVRAVNGEDVRAATFDDILDAIVRSESDPVTLTLSRWAAGPNERDDARGQVLARIEIRARRRENARVWIDVSHFTNRDRSWKHQDGHRARVSLRRHARRRDDGV